MSEISKGDYEVPIFFDPKDNGTEVPNPLLDYSLSKKGEFTLGNITFPLSVTDVTVDRFLSGKNAQYRIKFFWPGGFLSTGKIVVKTNIDQKVVFESEFDHSSQSSKGKTVTDDHEEVILYENEISKWGKNTPFKFCVEEYILDLKRSLCSKDLILVDGANGIEVHASTQVYPNEVRFNNAPVELKGSMPIKYGEITQCSSRFSDGSEFHLDLRPVTFKVLDLVFDSEKQQYIVTGENGEPIGEGVTFKNDLWTAKMPKASPYMLFATENKIVLRQEFKFAKTVPTEKMRAKLKNSTTNSTYLSAVPLRGYLPEPGTVNSKENVATATSPNSFDWEFKALEKGSENESRITLNYNNKETYVGKYKMYRGFPIEASTRLTSQTSVSGTMILGEVLATGWLERVFKSESKLFSIQRWGLSARYVTSLTAPPDPANSNAPMTFRSVDAQLRYRFTPGVWNQIQTFGLTIPYQSVSFEGAAGSMLGVGAFWVKPLPSFIDKLLSKVKWFRYPKIIDAELQYFMMPMTSGITLGTNLNLIFHGKIFLKPTFFVEGAFGYKQLGYTQASVFTLNLSTFYASIGAGWDF